VSRHSLHDLVAQLKQLENHQADLAKALVEAEKLLEMDTAVLYASRTSEEIKLWGSKVDERHFEIAQLKKKQQRSIRRNPLEATWGWLREHPFLAIVISLSPVMIAGGPTAVAGFFMIVMTVAVLWFLGRSLFRHWTRKDALAARRGPAASTTTTIYTLPGGVLKVSGTLTPEQLAELAKRFRSARDQRATLVLPAGTKYLPAPGAKQPSGVVTGGPLPLGESVSAMHPDAVEEPGPLHPELPAWMRETWNKALAGYRDRVLLEGQRYWNLKLQWRELSSSAAEWDHGPSGPGDMAARVRNWGEGLDDHVFPATLKDDILRLARQFDTISEEGAVYGERLVRSEYGRRRIAKQSGYEQAIVEVGKPEMPRDFVPVLDRDFQLTTDCRFHHVADHQIVEQGVTTDHVLRRCTVCEPATYWLERA